MGREGLVTWGVLKTDVRRAEDERDIDQEKQGEGTAGIWAEE